MVSNGVEFTGKALTRIPEGERDDMREHLLDIAAAYGWWIEVSAVEEQG